MPGVCSRDPSGQGDAGGARQSKCDHIARGVRRRTVPRGESPSGRRAPPRAQEEEEDGEES